MSIFERSESKVVPRDAMMNGDLYTTTAMNCNDDVTEKQNGKVPVPEGENPDINVTDGVNLGGGGNGDETEEPSGGLSSFNDTVSGGDDGLGLSDDEINSEFCGIGQAAWDDYPGSEEASRTRKKKVTSHWRNFVRPIMWRCKWAELQMRKFQIQASMYSRLLEEFDQARQTLKENFSSESQCSKTVPFPHQMKRRKVMRRTKRTRVEDTNDAVSFSCMLQHNLFGCCENKGSSTDYAHLTNGFVNSVIPALKNDGVNLVGNDEAFAQFDDEETSLEWILAKLDSMRSRVRNLKTQVDNVISENHGRFSSLDEMHLLTTPGDSGASTVPDPTAPPSDEDNFFITSPSTSIQPVYEHHVGEASMPVIPVTASLPDVLEDADHPMVANKSVDADITTDLKVYPITEDKLRVYIRAKKHKTMSEKQSNSSSSVPQTQNERSSVFVASRIAALRQKKRGKRKRASSVKKTFEGSLSCGSFLRAVFLALWTLYQEVQSVIIRSFPVWLLTLSIFFLRLFFCK